MIIAEEIKQLRAILGITQKELAEKIGTSIKTIANYEAGAVIPMAKQRLLHSLLLDTRNNISNHTDILNNNKSVNNEGSINNRIQIIINKLFNEKKANFCRAANVSPTTLSNTIGTRQSKPSSDFLASIIIGLPEVNSEWLLTGQGEMLKQDTKEGINLNNVGSGIIANSGTMGNVQHYLNNVVDDGMVKDDKDQQIILLKEKVLHLEEMLKEKERVIQILLKNS